jgi:hypothetical protein
VDLEGYAIVAGEGNVPVLEKTIARMIEEHRELGTLNETPVEVLPPQADAGSLRLPGKVAAGPLSPRISSSTSDRAISFLGRRR